MPGRLPGAGVGGPGALTGGEKRFPPVGLMLFSVGGGGVAELELEGVVVEGVVVEVVGALLSPPAHATNAMNITAKSATPAALWHCRVEHMIASFGRGGHLAHLQQRRSRAAVATGCRDPRLTFSQESAPVFLSLKSAWYKPNPTAPQAIMRIRTTGHFAAGQAKDHSMCVTKSS